MDLGPRSLALAASNLPALHVEIVIAQRGAASLRNKEHCASYTQSVFDKTVCVNVGSACMYNISEIVDKLIQAKFQP